MAIDLDGVDQYIDCGSGSVRLPNDTEHTMCCWINVGAKPSAGEWPIIMGARGSTSTGHWLGLDGTNSRLNYTFGTGFLYYRAVIPWWQIDVGKWYHVAGGFTAWMRVYLDGIEKDATSSVSFSQSNRNFRLGYNQSGSDYYEGRIADARVYDRELSLAEIKTIVAARGHDGIVDGLLSRWGCKEGAPGSTVSGAGVVRDSSNDGNHGTPYNSPVYYEDTIVPRRRLQ